jgi:CrcB protein
VLLVAAGGVLGALARAGAGALLPHEPGTWAWSTLAVNALGAAVLCALLTTVRDDRVRLLVGTGVLGAFTTFSAFAVDAVLLADAGRLAVAAAYVVVGLGTLLLAGLLGLVVGRRVLR